MSNTSNEESISIDLNDIGAAVRLFDTAANDGGFKGWETMREAFRIRQKFALFVQQIVERQAAEMDAPGGTDVPDNSIPEKDENTK